MEKIPHYLAEEIEKFRKKILFKYMSFFFLAFIALTILTVFFMALATIILSYHKQFLLTLCFPGLCILPYFIFYPFQDELISLDRQEVFEYSVFFWCFSGIFLIIVFFISMMSTIKNLSNIFTEYVKRKIISNTDASEFKIDNYFSSTNWFYTVYKNIFPNANKIKTQDCFLIDYAGRKLRVAKVDIGKEIGMGKRSVYFPIFRGYFIQVPTGISNTQNNYPHVFLEDYCIFILQESHARDLNLVSVYFPIYMRVNFYDLEKFYNGVLSTLRIVSNVIK